VDGARRHDLVRRLELYSAAGAIKRSTGHWQLYAAVTGSALAMATGVSAAAIGSGAGEIAAASIASVLAAKRNPASSQNLPQLRAAGLAVSRTRANTAQAAQTTGLPAITPGGIVPLYGSVNTIQPGEWISIYGSNLAASTETWSGDFPQSLAGTSVQINGKPAYLMFVSPTQINLQAPDDSATGSVSVVVTTATGSVTAGVTLNQFAPSFSLVETSDGVKFVSGIILRSNGSGAFGGGAYDVLGPTGSFFGYPTVAAKVGDTVELYAVGLGPTTPTVLAGQAFSGAAAIDAPLTLYINNIVVKPSFAGISSAGLYQINLTVPPGLGYGEVPIQVMIGGMQGQAGVLFSLQYNQSGGGPISSGGPIVSGGPGFGFGTSSPGFGGGTFGGGGSGGGSGGSGGSVRRHKKTWHPTLKFTTE